VERFADSYDDMADSMERLVEQEQQRATNAESSLVAALFSGP
jgi:hypothetical protein